MTECIEKNLLLRRFQMESSNRKGAYCGLVLICLAQIGVSSWRTAYGNVCRSIPGGRVSTKMSRTNSAISCSSRAQPSRISWSVVNGWLRSPP